MRQSQAPGKRAHGRSKIANVLTGFAWLDPSHSNTLRLCCVVPAQHPEGRLRTSKSLTAWEGQRLLNSATMRNGIVFAPLGTTRERGRFGRGIQDEIAPDKPKAFLRPTAQRLVYTVLVFTWLLLIGSAQARDVLRFDPERIGPRTVPVKAADYQVILHVSQATGSDQGGDGSAGRPWKTITHALAQIENPKDINLQHAKRYALLVAAGRYADGTIQMKEEVDLYGGFEPAGWTRDIKKHLTVLSGRGERRVIVGANFARVDGFVIRDGAVRGYGGALLCDGVSPRVTHNVFTGNMTQMAEGWNPTNRHLLAHDGGAIACLNHAQPFIQGNIFAGNSTEVGRGGALACHAHASPTIVDNVFVENIAGQKDEKACSEGGAISINDYSNPLVANNIICRNKQPYDNDGGGIAIMEWSSPEIRCNVLAGNTCPDDGGGIYISGDTHRVGGFDMAPPPKDEHLIRLIGNVIAGNGKKDCFDSGAMRVTMRARVHLINNVITENDNGLYLQRAELVLAHNTIDNKIHLEENFPGYDAALFQNNIVTGRMGIGTDVDFVNCVLPGTPEGKTKITERGTILKAPAFLEDGLRLKADQWEVDPAQFVTTVTVKEGLGSSVSLAGRVARITGKHLWTVVKSSSGKTLELWGTIPYESTDGGAIEILRTFRLRPDSPCIDAGTPETVVTSDIEGRPRGAQAWRGFAPDIGAHEFHAAAKP